MNEWTYVSLFSVFPLWLLSAFVRVRVEYSSRSKDSRLLFQWPCEMRPCVPLGELGVPWRPPAAAVTLTPPAAGYILLLVNRSKALSLGSSVSSSREHNCREWNGKPRSTSIDSQSQLLGLVLLPRELCAMARCGGVAAAVGHHSQIDQCQTLWIQSPHWDSFSSFARSFVWRGTADSEWVEFGTFDANFREQGRLDIYHIGTYIWQGSLSWLPG